MLYRGAYPLDEISQENGVDYNAHLIECHYGAETTGYRHLDGAVSLYSPASPALWLEFASWEEFTAFTLAYECTVTREPHTGVTFVVRLPDSAADFDALVQR